MTDQNVSATTNMKEPYYYISSVVRQEGVVEGLRLEGS